MSLLTLFRFADFKLWVVAKSEICEVVGELGTTSLAARTLGTRTFVARLHLRLSSAYHQGTVCALMSCSSCIASLSYLDHWSIVAYI
jgi:hypothetical protein